MPHMEPLYADAPHANVNFRDNASLTSEGSPPNPTFSIGVSGVPRKKILSPRKKARLPRVLLVLTKQALLLPSLLLMSPILSMDLRKESL